MICTAQLTSERAICKSYICFTQTLHRFYQELYRAVPWFAEDIRGIIVCTSTAGVRQEPHQAHSSQGDKVATLLLCHYHPPPCYQMELLLWWYICHRGVLDRQNPEESSSGPYNPQGHRFPAPASYTTTPERKILTLKQSCGFKTILCWF